MAEKRKKRPFPFSIDSILADDTNRSTSAAGQSSSFSSTSKQLHWALRRAEVRLEGAELWRRFHTLGTEMIVTRSGRRMFPTLQCSVRGLEPTERFDWNLWPFVNVDKEWVAAIP
jgi:hypothetical protein